MSLQEAASSGSFNPHVAQPTETQRADSPFDPPVVDDVDRVSDGASEPNTPFGSSYDYPTSVEDMLGAPGDPGMGTSRRRAWTVVGLAIIIPAAVAGVIAWQLFGGSDPAAPSVTRVTTAPAAAVQEEVSAIVAEPAASSVAVEPEPAAAAATPAAASPTVAVTTTAEPAATDEGGAESAAAAPEVDLSSLTPAARLAAWTEIQTIQVLPGETLWLIAQDYGTTISAIATLNGITNPELLTVGQELRVPVGFAEEIVEAPAAVSETGETTAEDAASTGITAAATEAAPLTDELSNWHTIAPVSIDDGDSLAAIALANNTTVEAIMALNGITDPHLIFVGDVVLVPVGYQGETPGVTLTTQQSSTEASSDGAAEPATDDAAAGAEDEDLMETEGTGAEGGEEEDMLEE